MRPAAVGRRHRPGYLSCHDQEIFNLSRNAIAISRFLFVWPALRTQMGAMYSFENVNGETG